jgi:hypothetical protein
MPETEQVGALTERSALQSTEQTSGEQLAPEQRLAERGGLTRAEQIGEAKPAAEQLAAETRLSDRSNLPRAEQLGKVKLVAEQLAAEEREEPCRAKRLAESRTVRRT